MYTNWWYKYWPIKGDNHYQYINQISFTTVAAGWPPAVPVSYELHIMATVDSYGLAPGPPFTNMI